MHSYDRTIALAYLSLSTPQLLGIAFIVLGIFLSGVAIYFLRTSHPDPFRDDWWYRNRLDSKIGSVLLFKRMAYERRKDQQRKNLDLPSDHPSAPQPVVKMITKKPQEDWKTFLARWDKENGWDPKRQSVS